MEKNGCQTAADEQVYRAPVGYIETVLAAIFSEVLKVNKIGREHNFPALGGHSLSSLRVIAAVQKRLGIQTSVEDVLLSPSIRDLALRIAPRGEEFGSI